jgi:uncharacterized protein YcaQ
VADVIHLSPVDARRFHRRALLLDTPVTSIGAALTHLGFIQIDPINVCGRMHDLVLRNRVADYREGGLFRHLHGPATDPPRASERTAFEHHLPGSNVLAALTFDAWPHLLAAMRQRSRGVGSWSGQMDGRQRRLSKTILAEISARGPICSDDIDDARRDHLGWGAHASLAKTTLHKLFFHGQVIIARRAGIRRYYDLPERVLPSAILMTAEPSAAETQRWLILLKLRQRRLVALGPKELSHVMDLVQRLSVDGCPPLYCLREDLPLLDTADAPSETRLLAPLDPLIYDRRLTRRLWGYDYTWEVYTPAARRVRGYYALPVLVGVNLVGHIDPKADRLNQKLVVVSRSIGRGHRTVDAVRELASFLGLKPGLGRRRLTGPTSSGQSSS